MKPLPQPLSLLRDPPHERKATARQAHKSHRTPLRNDAWIDLGWLMLESYSFHLVRDLWVIWWGLKVIRNSWSMIHSLTRFLITSPAEWMRSRPLISFRVCFNSARKCRVSKHGLNLFDNLWGAGGIYWRFGSKLQLPHHPWKVWST